MTFTDTYKKHDFNEIARRIYTTPRERALSALERGAPGDLDDFLALLSPAAEEFLEELALRARRITRERFGNTVQLYAPLYLSNECRSICTYCGFRRDNNIKRITLTLAEALREADIIYRSGIRHILLLTGEDYRKAPVDYIAQISQALAEKFPSISIEVYPLQEDDYARLRENGVDGLTVYQETYDPEKYREVHLGGVKRHMEQRLECPDRAGRAGLRKTAIGALLGLSDPAAETFFTGLHARYLMKAYWRTQYSIALPRLRPAAGFVGAPPLADRRFVQYLCALRLFLPDAGLVLSTREGPRLRDNLADICITAMSAGSRTDPGGYSDLGADGQFSIEDNRTVDEIKRMLESHGLEPLFVDWSGVMK